MSLFNAPPQPDPRQMLQQIKADPAGMLRQRGLTVPGGMSNPQQIVQHLVQSGQVPQSRLTQLLRMVGGG